MHMRVVDSNSSFLFTVVYGSPKEAWRQYLWRNLEVLASSSIEPWLLAGDFNAIIASEERRNLFGRPGQPNAAFVDCLLHTNLLDMGFAGNKFTWKSGSKSARLDRCLCNSAWRVQFQEASVSHLERVGSDHCPILVRAGQNPPSMENCPFRFQAAWLTHPEFAKFVEDNWDSSCNISDTIQGFTQHVKKGNREVFGNIHLRKKKLLARIAGIQRHKYLRSSGTWAGKWKKKEGSGLWRALSAVWPNFRSLIGWEVHDGNSVSFWSDRWLTDDACLADNSVSPILPALLMNSVAQMVSPEGEWKWEVLSPFVSSQTLQELSLRATPEASLGLANDPLCADCGNAVETGIHAVRDCLLAKDVWISLLRKNIPDEFFSINTINWLKLNLNGGNGIIFGLQWESIFAVAWWLLWQWRNQRIFDPNAKPVGNPVQTILRSPRWNAPSGGMVKCNVAIHVAEDSGLATSGCCVRDNQGSWLGGYVAKLGACSQFKAIRWALLYALQVAKTLQCAAFTLESCSGDGIKWSDANSVAIGLAKLADNYSSDPTILSSPPHSITELLEVDKVLIFLSAVDSTFVVVYRMLIKCGAALLKLMQA
ncbi:hypothetical protein Tsubulata_006169 [Turnera subulata]|uniref:Endonuclease/exonuclease/phosphatase domain-containing protein n=1 Tax=Turnera subulata TaxID=218843 RepID=A0A9Q0JAZ8_9ROSI|nr:hypothetical protein Tsubulata_006169 [Turnera subulata]